MMVLNCPIDQRRQGTDLLLFRTHQFDPATRAFCARLCDEAGLPFACVVDETRGALEAGCWPKIGVSRETLKPLGLHCPDGFEWRCGDYGLYLAAQAYPDASHFWLVEYDVRIHTAGSLGDFFAAFAADTTDLIAPMFGERQEDWWWYPAMASRAEPVYGCLFPILRVSARLARAGLEGRRRIGRSPLYRLFWPNDESFLANEAMRSAMTCRDLNAEGRTLYTNDTFSFDAPVLGSALEAQAPDGLIHHPVLYGTDYERKRRKLGTRTATSARVFRKLRLMMRAWA